jgi:U3 small nucleolar RNA-associated protein 21
MPSTVVANTAEGPVVKRQRLSGAVANGGKQARQSSKIFAPFRTVGLVSSTAVPFTSIPLGKTSFQITTSVGRCLQTYDLKRGLNLVFLTRPQTPEDITATLAYKDKVYAAWCGDKKGAKPGIWSFKRGKKVDELEVPADLDQPIQQILIFGTWIVACCTTRIEVWRSTTLEHYTSIHTVAAPKGGNEIVSITNMPTYLNKIFAGRKDGSIDIFNVNTGKHIYTILPPMADCGSVTAMSSTPALSLMAVAYSKGALIIHNIRTDKTQLLLQSKSLITSISFRTDGQGAGEDGKKDGVMATAGPSTGDVTFWDLNNGGRVMGVLRGAHNPPVAERGDRVGGGINKVEFLSAQPVIVTSGLDNSLKSWIFDETPYSPIPRILHTRSGHAAPVTKLQFLPSEADGADAKGKWLLSAGKDRSLWGWSLRRDGQSTELSQGNIRKKAKKLGILASSTLANEPSTTLEDLKAPEITCIASCLNRDGGMGAHTTGAVWQKGHQRPKHAGETSESAKTGWESVVTGHKGDKYARTWFWGRKKAGRWAFETGDGADVSAVAVSPCGTFAVVASAQGGMDMFNLQSGAHRLRFPSKLTPAQARQYQQQRIAEADGKVVKAERFPLGTGKHTKAVTGVVVDSLNRYVISCSLDGKIKFWDFNNGRLVDEINWAPLSSITSMVYHAPSDLIAVTCDDGCIRVVDTETKRTIRELWGLQDGITDFTFSSDGRWIVGAGGDRTLRVWDLVTGHCIDAVRFRTPCTALAFNPTGEFLATACEGELGVSIWNNKTLFTHVPTRQIGDDEIADLSGPTVSGEGGAGLIDAAFAEEQEEDDVAPVKSLDQLSADLETLSLVPKSRWQTLLHLDLIRQRNKPTAAPTQPEKAPFFLPSLEGGKPNTSLLGVAASAEPTEAESRITRREALSAGNGEGAFERTLREGRQTGEFTPFVQHLATLSPSAADLAIRSLAPAPGQEPLDLVAFVHALTQRLKQKRDYELVQAWMAVLLKLHAEAVAGSAALVEALGEWKAEEEKEGRRLGELVGYCSGVVGFLRSPRT